MTSTRKDRPNWLFYGLIALSIAIHLVIFLHIADIYRSRTITFIELTLRDITRHRQRIIPAPSRINSESSQPARTESHFQAKSIKPHPPEAPPKAENLIGKKRSLSYKRADAGKYLHKGYDFRLDSWSGETGGRRAERQDIGDYLREIRLRIENYKQYPSRARQRQIEGSATLRFTIEPDGRVTGLDMIRGSGHQILNRAAIRAVRDASPFPDPPAGVSGRAVPVEITIQFRLTG